MLFFFFFRMSDSESDEVYDFTIVRFIHRGRRRAVEEIDIVNSDWLHYDGKKGKCTTKFMQSITDEEDVVLIHSLVKELSPAPESWPQFPVEIVGRASKFDKKFYHVTCSFLLIFTLSVFQNFLLFQSRITKLCKNWIC